jgi:hypothetical protein
MNALARLFTAFQDEFPEAMRILRRRTPGAARTLRNRTLEGLAFLRLGRVLALAVLAVAILAGFRIGPVVYGRFALAQEAATAARQSQAAGEARVLLKLNQAAFRLGFTEAALAADTFKLEFVQEDGIDQCAVSYDFVHTVDCYGLARLPWRVKDRVVRPMIERLPDPDPDKMVQ